MGNALCESQQGRERKKSDGSIPSQGCNTVLWTMSKRKAVTYEAAAQLERAVFGEATGGTMAAESAGLRRKITALRGATREAAAAAGVDVASHTRDLRPQRVDSSAFSASSPAAAAAAAAATAAATSAAAAADDAVWHDDDDDEVAVSVAAVSRLRKLRRVEEERVVSGAELQRRLREQ